MNIGIDAIEVMNKLITPQLSRLELKNEKLAETEKIILHEQFDYLMREKESQMVLYFQSLATILFVIGHTDLIPENGKAFYFQILNSQITPQEKTFIFYYMSCSRKEKIGGGAFATLHRVEHMYHFMRFSDVRLFHKSHRILVQYWEDIYKEIDP